MIKRLKIRDFKSIRDLDLELDPVTVLVGRSGTGKSNIVQALRFLRNVLLDSEKALQFEGGWERLKPVGMEKPKPGIEVLFSIPGETQLYTYRVDYSLSARHQGMLALTSECLLLGAKPLYSRSLDQSKGWVWETKPTINPQTHNHDVPMPGAFPSLQQVVFAFAALSTGMGCYHFPSTALALPTQPNPNEEFLQKIPGLRDDGMNYREIIRALTQDFHRPKLRQSLLASVQAVDPSIVSIELDSLINPNRAIVTHKAGNNVFDLSLDQESDGLRRFYAHLLALYQTPAKLTLIFEEPENAIFPGALSLLADEFKAAPRENRGQVILTTHNPALLDAFDVENVRVVEMRDGQTMAGRVSKEQRDAVKEQLMTTGDLLRVERARMEDKPGAVQVA